MREVGSDESGDDAPMVEEEESDESEDSDVESEEAVVPAGKAYSALLESFRQPEEDGGRSRKRRKLEQEEPAKHAMQTANGADRQSESDAQSDAEPGVEVDEESEAEGDEQYDGAELEDAANGATGDASSDDEPDQSDPFEVHFANPDENDLAKRLKVAQAGDWLVDRVKAYDDGHIDVAALKKCGSAVRKPQYGGAEDLPLKAKLVPNARKHLAHFDDVQRSIAPYMLKYTDVLVGDRTPANAESLRNLSCLHALNHVLKGRDKVLKNTTRLSQAGSDQSLELRDQGFTRPKVLILTETRQMASRYADCIVDLFEPEQQENKQRFKDSFTDPIDDRDTMPEDYRELFGGNNDNNFLTALKFTRKTLKFFSAFYTSDIILASPLGLRRVIEHEDRRKRDHDFLSSIELLILDQADAMQMQNWENVELVFNHLNLQPKDLHGCDVNRVRPYYLDNNAKYLRQTLIFTSYITPEMNRLFNTHLGNLFGKAKLTPNYPGALTSATGLGVKQTFSRFASASPAADPDARFKYFTTAILPQLLRLPKPADGAQGILVFIPSYYDFLRVRNFFATSDLTANISFGAIHDYSETSEQRRARSHFLSGRHSILLYTQRAHHFFRLRIKGVKRVVCYALPDNEVFYREVVGGFLGTSLGEGRVAPEEAGARALFSRFDGLRLERCVGSERVRGLLGGGGDTFDFV